MEDLPGIKRAQRDALELRQWLRLAYVSNGGVITKPSGESWKRFMTGDKIVAPEWHYVVTPTFETGSATYGWLNDCRQSESLSRSRPVRART